MMQEPTALLAFTALSDATRLRIVRLLVRAGPEGLPAGAIGSAMAGATASRMSFHLKHLEHAGLVTARRDGRFVHYSAVFATLADLLAFLMQDCCQGHPEICAPALACACPTPAR